MSIATQTERKRITIRGARSVFTHSCEDDLDLENLIHLLTAEMVVKNQVNLIICVGRDRIPQVEFEE